ncbi:MAG: hypothetical protein MZV64_33885 [Ignavibacteriales bacterium]|nr:hypothetical protein [Ignavibacteriales bacterium]
MAIRAAAPAEGLLGRPDVVGQGPGHGPGRRVLAGGQPSALVELEEPAAGEIDVVAGGGRFRQRREDEADLLLGQRLLRTGLGGHGPDVEVRRQGQEFPVGQPARPGRRAELGGHLRDVEKAVGQTVERLPDGDRRLARPVGDRAQGLEEFLEARLDRRVLVRRRRIEVGDERQDLRALADPPEGRFPALTPVPLGRLEAAVDVRGEDDEARREERRFVLGHDLAQGDEGLGDALLRTEDAAGRGLDRPGFQGREVLARPQRPVGRPDEPVRSDLAGRVLFIDGLEDRRRAGRPGRDAVDAEPVGPRGPDAGEPLLAASGPNDRPCRRAS